MESRRFDLALLALQATARALPVAHGGGAQIKTRESSGCFAEA